MPAHVQGCVKGRSAVTNARLHLNKPIVINIDLSDFFGSVSFDAVNEILTTHFNFDERASEVFARLTVVGDGLPQGARTSPVLANIAALELDADIIELCRQVLLSDRLVLLDQSGVSVRSVLPDRLVLLVRSASLVLSDVLVRLRNMVLKL